MKHDSIVIHYDEIGLKGKNRAKFEILLMDSIRKKIGLKPRRESGQIALDAKPSKSAKEILSKMPGIAYFSPAKKSSLNMEEIKELSIQLLKSRKFQTFRIDAKRRDKNYGKTSLELNQIIGEEVAKKLKKKVNLQNPDITLKVEISNHAYLSTESLRGIGGLPTNPRQKMLTLVSGGFDSPVAAYMMMKRGCEVILIHFHNKSQSPSSVKNKIIALAKQLSKFQLTTKLYIVPFEKLQKKIIAGSKAELRMLIYRRIMLKISSMIAERENAGFLVLGDSLSQVASQTLENLKATYEASEVPVLSPLIGLNKCEIISIAKRIRTYEPSSQPCPDCCSYFLPRHPVLKARLSLLKWAESAIDRKLMEDAVKRAKIRIF